VAGLLAGADDYIAKPFSARELVARVDGQIALARTRREGHERFQALISASWDVVYRMSPDWTQMRALDGRGFIADTPSPSASWLDEYIHPDDQPRVLAAIRAAIRDKATFALEHRVRRPDGSLAWTLSQAVPLLDDQGEIVEWVGAATDVTGRKQAEQQLAAALAEAPPQVIWVADARGAVTEDSPSWRAFTGQAIAERLGHGWIDAVHPEDRDDARRQWREMAEGGPHPGARFRLWHAPTRTWRLTQVRVVPLHHEDGTLRGWLGLGTDLTSSPGAGGELPW
jgi:PAS domain S-box-containing protein